MGILVYCAHEGHKLMYQHACNELKLKAKISLDTLTTDKIHLISVTKGSSYRGQRLAPIDTKLEIMLVTLKIHKKIRNFSVYDPEVTYGSKVAVFLFYGMAVSSSLLYLICFYLLFLYTTRPAWFYRLLNPGLNILFEFGPIRSQVCICTEQTFKQTNNKKANK